MPDEQYSFERYLNVRSAFAPSFSHDGKRLSFLTNITGVAGHRMVCAFSIQAMNVIAAILISMNAL